MDVLVKEYMPVTVAAVYAPVITDSGWIEPVPSVTPGQIADSEQPSLQVDVEGLSSTLTSRLWQVADPELRITVEAVIGRLGRERVDSSTISDARFILSCVTQEYCASLLEDARSHKFREVPTDIVQARHTHRTARTLGDMATVALIEEYLEQQGYPIEA